MIITAGFRHKDLFFGESHIQVVLVAFLTAAIVVRLEFVPAVLDSGAVMVLPQCPAHLIAQIVVNLSPEN